MGSKSIFGNICFNHVILVESLLEVKLWELGCIAQFIKNPIDDGHGKSIIDHDRI